VHTHSDSNVHKIDLSGCCAEFNRLPVQSINQSIVPGEKEEDGGGHVTSQKESGMKIILCSFCFIKFMKLFLLT
jgi:hypothetical protein